MKGMLLAGVCALAMCGSAQAEPASHQERCIVGASAHVRTRPTIKALVLDTIEDGGIVFIYEHQGKWVFIRAYDESYNNPPSGWVYRQYLKECE
jgi:hypothetical protein